MRVLIQFNSIASAPNILAPFLAYPGVVADEHELTVPGVIRIVIAEDLRCYCLNLTVAEELLGRLCETEVDQSGNHGRLRWPKDLAGVLLEVTLGTWEPLLTLTASGHVSYVHTTQRRLKATLALSAWLEAELTVDYPQLVLQLRFKDHELQVSDGSAASFCRRVKANPILSATGLLKTLQVPDLQPQPKLEYLTLWKVLYSEHGYKRYAQFLNDQAAYLDVGYESHKGYHCKFTGGYVDFQLESLGDKYPKKVVLQVDNLTDTPVLTILGELLAIKTLDLVAKVVNLNLTPPALRDLNFVKHEDFFLFTRFDTQLQARYDIGSAVLTVKQELKLATLTSEQLTIAKDGLQLWLREVMNHG